MSHIRGEGMISRCCRVEIVLEGDVREALYKDAFPGCIVLLGDLTGVMQKKSEMGVKQGLNWSPRRFHRLRPMSQP